MLQNTQNQKGIVHLFLILTVLSIIAAIFIINTFSFKNNIFSSLFGKDNSYASANTIQIVDNLGQSITSTTSASVKVQLTEPTWKVASLNALKTISFLQLKEIFAKGPPVPTPLASPTPTSSCKQGVTSFSVDSKSKCGKTSYYYANYTCADGSSGKLGSGTSCQTDTYWSSQANLACSGKTNGFCATPTPLPTVAPTPTPTIAPTSTPTPIPSPTPTSVPVTTVNVILAEDQNFTINVQTFTYPLINNPVDYTFSDSSVGTKSLYAKFTGSDGSTQNAMPFPVQVQLKALNDTAYNLGVLVIKYFPLTSDGQNIDITITGDVGDSYSNISQRTINVTSNLVNFLAKGTKYLGYQNASANPSLNYQVVDTKEYTQAVPIKPIGSQTTYPDYNLVMTQNNICNYIDNQNVREVWLFAYQGPSTQGPNHDQPYLGISESKMSGPFGDISNSPRYNEMPLCQHTYRVYTFNYGRGTSEAMESWGHQMEAELDAIDKNLFRTLYQGPNYPQTIGVNGRCGSVHNPPNARFEYDRANTLPQNSDCLDWNPDSPGTLSQISCYNWSPQCRDNGDADNPNLNYMIWNWQNLPGAGNTKSYQGNNFRNWWDVHGDFDGVMGGNNKSLYQVFHSPTPSPTPTPTSTPTPQSAPSLPLVSAPSCSNIPYQATISWSSVYPNVAFADIGLDSGFGATYNKAIPSGATSTLAPDNFAPYSGVTGPLVLNPNTTYYTRTFNYFAHSPTASFRVSTCP